MNLIKRQQLKRFAGIFILSAFLINSYAPVLVQAAQPGTEAQKPEEKKKKLPLFQRAITGKSSLIKSKAGHLVQKSQQRQLF